MARAKKAAAKAAAPKPAPASVADDTTEAPDAEASPFLHKPHTTERAPWLDENPKAAAAMSKAVDAADAKGVEG
jgi:hypothetical protein